MKKNKVEKGKVEDGKMKDSEVELEENEKKKEINLETMTICQKLPLFFL